MTEPRHRATSMDMTQQQSPPALPLYERVEQLRLEQGWTRVRLAQVANVSRGTIDSWKTQPRPPLAPTVVAVADRLGIDQDEALRLAGIKRTVQGRMTAGTAGPPAERHLQPVQGGGDSPAPDEFGLGEEPPFPGVATNASGLNTPEILNRVWAMAKEMESAYYRERDAQGDPKRLRVIQQYELAAKALIEDLGDAG